MKKKNVILVVGNNRAELELLSQQIVKEGCGTLIAALHQAKMPFIIISPQRSPLVQKESLKHGASGLLVKPLGNKELIEYMHTLLGE
jgi:DNA-binding response OmpR family regulator